MLSVLTHPRSARTTSVIASLWYSGFSPGVPYDNTNLLCCRILSENDTVSNTLTPGTCLHPSPDFAAPLCGAKCMFVPSSCCQTHLASSSGKSLATKSLLVGMLRSGESKENWELDKRPTRLLLKTRCKSTTRMMCRSSTESLNVTIFRVVRGRSSNIAEILVVPDHMTCGFGRPLNTIRGTR